MDLELEGKRALVTGSTSGIGEAIAKLLAAEGAHVVVHGRDEARARRVVDEIAAAGGTSISVLGDISKPDEAARVVGDIERQLAGVDVLVNNAGGSHTNNAWLETAPADWEKTFGYNVFSTVRMIQAFVPGMTRNRWGRVVQISSGVAIRPWPEAPDYAAAKAALVNMTVSLAQALTGTGVTTNTITPGPILTIGLQEGFERMAQTRGWVLDDWASQETRAVREFAPNPSDRLGRVDEIAAAVAYLCSTAAGFVNGANLRVDGGYAGCVN